MSIKSIYIYNDWCKRNFLDLNVDKTKEVRIDFRRSHVDKRPVVIDNKLVEVADSYKYLGLLADNKLSFKDHVEALLKKARKRLYCVRTMNKVHVDAKIISLFFNATIPSVLMYACTAFFGLLPQYVVNDLDRPGRICARLVKSCDILSKNADMYDIRVKQLALKIQKDSTHLLYNQFELLPSGRRLHVPRARTKRFQDTFVYKAIKMLNSSPKAVGSEQHEAAVIPYYFI